MRGAFIASLKVLRERIPNPIGRFYFQLLVLLLEVESVDFLAPQIAHGE